MYLLFMDESGTPPKPEKAAGRYLVIGSVVVPEGAWHAIAKSYRSLKKEYDVSGELKWKYWGRHNIEKGNELSKLSEDDRNELRDKIISLIVSRKAIKIISCVTSVEAVYDRPSITDQNDIYHLTYKGVTERFQYYLQDASRVTGQSQYGMIISDHRMANDDKKLRARHHRLMDGKEEFTSNYPNIVETIFFSPSEASIGLQLADMVAGAINRAYEHGDNRFARMLKPAFRASPTGEIVGYGLVKMPKGTFREPSGGEAGASPTR